MVALIASGCQTRESYEASAEIMRRQPAVKAEAIGKCQRTFETWPIASKRALAAYIGVSPAALPREWCRRIINMMASGELSYGEYVGGLTMRTDFDDPLFRKVRAAR